MQFNKKLEVGFINFDQQLARDDWGPGHYIRDQKGFRASGHLSGPDENVLAKKYKRLGHIQNK